MDYTPFHLSENCFRRYEAVIYKALHYFPRTVSFECNQGRSVRTEKARCSDAITSWLKRRWKTNFDINPLQMMQLSVWAENNTVFVGARGTRLRRVRNKINPDSVQILDALVVPSTSELPSLDRSQMLGEDANPPQEEMSLADRVRRIDEGEDELKTILPYSLELEEEIKTLIGDRIGVAYTVRDGEIILF